MLQKERIGISCATTLSKCDVQPTSNAVKKYFCPDLMEYLLGIVTPPIPVWSEILTSSVTTNAAVETHIRIVKSRSSSAEHAFGLETFCASCHCC